MVKAAIFAGGALVGFAVCATMSDEKRRRVVGRVRSVSESPTGQRLSTAAHSAADTVVDTAVSKVEQASDAVSEALPGKAQTAGTTDAMTGTTETSPRDPSETFPSKPSETFPPKP